MDQVSSGNLPSAKGIEVAASSTVENTGNQLLFFNYHEYSIKLYSLIGSSTIDSHPNPLIATHFPNIHALNNSEQFKKTRIVRIPRCYTGNGIIYPQFSTVLPGYEEAAINYEESNGNGDEDNSSNNFEKHEKRFIIKGSYEGQLYGWNSVSPLSNYLTNEEFHEIMTNINDLLAKGNNPFTIWNIIDYILGLLTFWLISLVIKPRSKKHLQELEDYIKETNTKLKNVKIISPRRSSYLSVSWFT